MTHESLTRMNLLTSLDVGRTAVPACHRPIRVMQVLTRLGAGGPPLHVLCLNHEMGRYGYEMLLETGTWGLRDLETKNVGTSPLVP